MTDTTIDEHTPELRAAHRLMDVARALQRHSGEEIARVIADLATSLSYPYTLAEERVAHRDVALAVLGEQP